MIGAVEAAAIGLAVAGAALLLRPVIRPQYAERWARASGLQLTPKNRELIASYLRRTRLCRLLGGLLGFVLPWLSLAVTGGSGSLPKPFDFGLFDMLIGYLVGAVAAELTITRPR